MVDVLDVLVEAHQKLKELQQYRLFQLSMNRDRNNIKIDYYTAILLGLQNYDFFFPRASIASRDLSNSTSTSAITSADSQTEVRL